MRSLDPPVRSMVERFGAQMRTLLRDRTMRARSPRSRGWTAPNAPPSSAASPQARRRRGRRRGQRRGRRRPQRRGWLRGWRRPAPARRRTAAQHRRPDTRAREADRRRRVAAQRGHSRRLSAVSAWRDGTGGKVHGFNYSLKNARYSSVSPTRLYPLSRWEGRHDETTRESFSCSGELLPPDFGFRPVDVSSTSRKPPHGVLPPPLSNPLPRRRRAGPGCRAPLPSPPPARRRRLRAV